MNTVLPWASKLLDLSTRLGPGLSGDLASLELPPLHHVRQNFPRPLIEDVRGAVTEQILRDDIRALLKPGNRVCLLVGSRGVARIAEIVRAAADALKSIGMDPFIIPAMGSHGGATGDGQRGVLADYGITEETMGVPIIATMDTQVLGETPSGIPVHASADALAADAIIPIGRIKPHTGFRAEIESGLVKMLTIGLGKQRGADTLHAQGMDQFGELLPAAARIVLATGKVAFGLGVVENAYDQPAHFEAVPAATLESREKELLTLARSLMPSLPFEHMHVLVIQQIGKNISGSGLDPNIAGRFVRSNGPAYSDKPEVMHVVVLDLTPETHGNASGLGLADLITLRVLEKIDLPSTYANCMTASHLAGAMIPLVMETDFTCIKAAVKTATRWTPDTLRLAIIHSTLEVGEFWISPALVEEAQKTPYLEISPTASPMVFDGDGNIVSPIACGNK